MKLIPVLEIVIGFNQSRQFDGACWRPDEPGDPSPISPEIPFMRFQHRVNLILIHRDIRRRDMHILRRTILPWGPREILGVQFGRSARQITHSTRSLL